LSRTGLNSRIHEPPIPLQLDPYSPWIVPVLRMPLVGLVNSHEAQMDCSIGDVFAQWPPDAFLAG